LEILEATDLVNSEAIHREIPSDMKRDISTEPEYWDWHAKLDHEYNPASRQYKSEEVALSQIEKTVQV
jgi:U3 small nucleolar RNA-associated protein 6